MSESPLGEITPEELARLLQTIEESKLVEVEISYGNLRVHVRKDGASEQPPASRGQPASGPVVRPVPPPAITPGARRVEVCAPMLGNFYRAPSPGAPPFIEVGQSVATKDTIGLIEVMKLFSEMKAGVAGRILEIRAEDGKLVEHGQVLVIVEVLD